MSSERVSWERVSCLCRHEGPSSHRAKPGVALDPLQYSADLSGRTRVTLDPRSVPSTSDQEGKGSRGGRKVYDRSAVPVSTWVVRSLSLRVIVVVDTVEHQRSLISPRTFRAPVLIHEVSSVERGRTGPRPCLYPPSPVLPTWYRSFVGTRPPPLVTPPLKV